LTFCLPLEFLHRTIRYKRPCSRCDFLVSWDFDVTWTCERKKMIAAYIYLWWLRYDNRHEVHYFARITWKIQFSDSRRAWKEVFPSRQLRISNISTNITAFLLKYAYITKRFAVTSFPREAILRAIDPFLSIYCSFCKVWEIPVIHRYQRRILTTRLDRSRLSKRERFLYMKFKAWLTPQPTVPCM